MHEGAKAWTPRVWFVSGENGNLYLTNNRSRMDYSTYRRFGLPAASSPMESLVKQINLRVKGTEMFWDDPAGAEAILLLRAA